MISEEPRGVDVEGGDRGSRVDGVAEVAWQRMLRPSRNASNSAGRIECVCRALA